MDEDQQISKSEELLCPSANSTQIKSWPFPLQIYITLPLNHFIREESLQSISSPTCKQDTFTRLNFYLVFSSSCLRMYFLRWSPPRRARERLTKHCIALLTKISFIEIHYLQKLHLPFNKDPSSRHSRQQLWPQDSVTGSTRGLQQIQHSVYSAFKTFTRSCLLAILLLEVWDGPSFIFSN